MSARTLFAVLALALLTLGTATAGTADDPEVTDGTLDATGPANLYADLTKGWLEQDGDVVTAHIEVARIDALQFGVAYLMTFDVDDTTYYVGLVQTDATTYYVGEWDRSASMPLSSDTTTGTSKVGSPAHLTIDFAASTFGRNVTGLSKIGLEALDFKGALVDDAGYVQLDAAVSDQTFELAMPYGEPIDAEAADAPPADAANVPLPIWAPILAAVGVAAFRRRA